MLRIYSVMFFVLVIHVVPAVLAQQTEGKLGIRVKVAPRISSPEGAQSQTLVRGPNDKVWLDSEGDVVVEGATLPSGEPFTFRVMRQTHIDPVFTSTFHHDGLSFEYRYRIMNGLAAKQWIHVFWIDSVGPVQVSFVPTYWLANVNRDRPPIHRVYIGRTARGTDTSGQLSAGESAGDFVLQSAWGPGLVRAAAIGHKPTPGEPGYDSKEAEMMADAKMSDWLRAEINRNLSTENNSVSVYTLGPKIAPGTPPTQIVRTELLEAVRVREFGSDRKALLELTAVDDLAAIRSRIQALAVGANGLRGEFYKLLLSYIP